MTPLLHSLQISTLATWLSVVGFGAVGVAVRNREPVRTPDSGFLETVWIPEDIVLGGESSPASEEPIEETTESTPAETLPAPPDMPDLAELDPLPEIPEIPPAEATSPPRESPRISRQPTPTANDSPSPRPSARRQASSGAPSQGNPKPGGGSGMSNAARLAAGNMPSPTYPAEARRKGQTGTVLVEFTVDASGRVISAYAKSASPWPLLNEEAVRTVRRWKFPPGGVMKLQRPIVFQLR